MDIYLFLNIILFVILIMLTILFVGSEFSFVKVRQARLDNMIAKGNKQALKVKEMTAELDYYLSACQLGITVTALGLGWSSKPMFEVFLNPFFQFIGIPEEYILIFTVVAAFSIVTFIHVVVGELAPKTIAIQYAEKMAMLFSKPLYFFGFIMKPLIWTMNGTSRLLLRMIGIKPAAIDQAHSEEELKVVIADSYKDGEINQTELNYMQNIFQFDERIVKDIMLPRQDMVIISQPLSKEKILQTLTDYNFTRYPVATESGDKDSIFGFINAREFLTEYFIEQDMNMNDYIHEISVVREHSNISEVLVKMQNNHLHIAIVVDEFGGTSGLITLEDILEEIVGDIYDELDDERTDEVIQIDSNNYFLNGRVLLSDIEYKFNIEFPDDENIETIAGWIQSQNINIVQGETVTMDNMRWEIAEMDNRTIKKVKMTFLETDVIQ